ncbi:HAD family hydrolase [Nesterenkonia aerolata]|uniref:HAD family phosphatase n=1 Tax=Nesterenkonia aerolata TaxID=3074079 RepID=A0ABU2DQB9_9MICC|nr:HAD family phosphatase [Nesterenkonia sp. LY-0111]MDR8018621.1 HAD family phosphatase [Nesterenkonia sp. LY-0111]
MPGSLQAVFWDMDGTLVDTEPHWIREETALVESFGARWTDSHAEDCVGQALPYTAARMQEAGVQMSVREIIDHLITRVAASAREQMPWRPGAREALSVLQQAGVRSALVTMSEPTLAGAVVEALPPGQLEFMVTGDAVSRGKPDPEAYLSAFETMARTHPEPLDPRRCLAFEDSVPGVTAAVDAGLVTVAVPHWMPIPESDRYQQIPGLQGLDLAAMQRLLPA